MCQQEGTCQRKASLLTLVYLACGAKSDKTHHLDGLQTNTRQTDMASPAALVENKCNWHNDERIYVPPCMLQVLDCTQS